VADAGEAEGKLLLDDRALIVALELLRRQMADVPMAIAVNAADAMKSAALQDRAQTARDPRGRAESPRFTDPREYGGDTSNIFAKRANAARDPNASPPPSVGAGAPGAGAMAPLISIGSALALKFTAIIGPLAILAAVIGSNISGFNVLMTAVRIVGTTLAPILLPVTAVLAAALVAASDVLWQQLLPALGDWYRFVLSNLIPAVLELADAFLKAADWILRNSVDKAEEAANFFENTQNDIAVNLASVAEAAGQVPEGTTAQLMKERDEARTKAEEKQPRFQEAQDAIEAFRNQLGRLRSEEAGGKGGFRTAFGSAMTDVIQSMRMSFSPKAQMSGLADVWKQATMAALNQDPLEARQLKVMQDSLDMLTKIWNEQRAGKPEGGAVYGAGQFEGDF
jgi:hypothetical protein